MSDTQGIIAEKLPSAQRCELCDKDEDNIYRDKEQNYTAKIEPFGILKLNDHTLNREYLYLIQYCPFCGRKVKRSKPATPRRCSLCERKKILFTSPGSNNKAEIFMQAKNFLTFYGDEGASYYIKCSYCPQCGRRLDC